MSTKAMTISFSPASLEAEEQAFQEAKEALPNVSPVTYGERRMFELAWHAAIKWLVSDIGNSQVMKEFVND
ncbi:MAG: hypothetical protein ACXAAP_14830 [Candidatus Thorarchaeota archaeon]|jgi:hypothetical protein